MEGIWVQKLNEQGEIYDLTVYLRPYPAVTVLRNMTKDLYLGQKTGALVGKDYWELPAPSLASSVPQPKPSGVHV